MASLHYYFSKENLKWLRIIGYYQIIGGIIGVLGMIWLFIQNIGLLIGVVATIGILLNALSIYAGISTVKHLYLKPTYYVQAIQILNFIGLGITYEVIFGSSLGFGVEWIDSANLVLNFQMFSSFSFKYSSSSNDDIRVVVNFIPIIIINYIMKCTEKAEERKILIEVDKIGNNQLYLIKNQQYDKNCFRYSK